MKTSAKTKISGELSAGWSALNALPTQTLADLSNYVMMRELCTMSHIFDVSVKGTTLTVQSAPITGKNQLFFDASEETYYFNSPITAQIMAIELFALELSRNNALSHILG